MMFLGKNPNWSVLAFEVLGITALGFLKKT